MEPNLRAIIAAAAGGTELILSTHYLRERLGGANRPRPSDIRYGLTRDAPKIVRVDLVDGRGALCEISCIATNGNEMTIRISYEKSPMKVVTAFFPGGPREGAH